MENRVASMQEDMATVRGMSARCESIESELQSVHAKLNELIKRGKKQVVVADSHPHKPAAQTLHPQKPAAAYAPPRPASVSRSQASQSAVETLPAAVPPAVAPCMEKDAFGYQRRRRQLSAPSLPPVEDTDIGEVVEPGCALPCRASLQRQLLLPQSQNGCDVVSSSSASYPSDTAISEMDLMLALGDRDQRRAGQVADLWTKTSSFADLL